MNKLLEENKVLKDNEEFNRILDIVHSLENEYQTLYETLPKDTHHLIIASKMSLEKSFALIVKVLEFKNR